MNGFVFHTPTKVVFGKEAEMQTGALVKEQGCKKVLVHYGGNSAKKSGLLDRVCRSLDEAGVSYVTLGGVVPNPRLSLVYEGIDLCRKEGVDFILAVGGGSVIDSSKAIAYGLGNDFDVWDLYDRKETAKGCYPVGCVLTIAAAGSEMSDSSVITKDPEGIKRGYNSPLCRCRFAVMNPELTYTLPDYQTACGAVDIMMHTMERYFVTDETFQLTDSMAEALIRTVMEQAKILKQDPKNYKARAEIMWAGSLAHNSLMNCGGPNGDWSTHQLEHELGGMFDVAHGAGLAAVWGSWARYVIAEKPQRFAQFAKNVFGIPEKEDPMETGLAGIEAMEAFYRSLEMPTSISELGIAVTEEQIEKLAENCAFGGRTIGMFRKLNKEDMAAIYRMAK
jgi:alcohol dehydrogenase YqhD (iron-dependent ADH family)